MHIPVLQKEVLEYLDPKPNENFIDATIGEGGHSLAILERNGPKGKILGIDQDPNQIENCKLKIKNFKNRVILACDNFVNLKEIVQKYQFKQVHPVRGQRGLVERQRKQTSNGVHGILFDLGMSSWHLEESGRGFTFQRREPLDMRYNSQNQLTPLEVNGARQKHKENKPLTGLTAEKIVNYWSRFELEKILEEYGEERFAKNITEKIIEERKIKPIENTFQLVEIVKKATPGWYQHKRIHFATRTFQALRIAVNDELNNFKKALPQAQDLLKPGGRLVVISFHSLEDRIVKNFLKEQVKEDLPKIRILTKKPVIPSRAEIKINPRARSAKLRAIIKM